MKTLFTEAERRTLHEAAGSIQSVIDHCLQSAEHAKAEAKKWEAKGGPKAKVTSTRERTLRDAARNYGEARGEATAYRDIVHMLRGLK